MLESVQNRIESNRNRNRKVYFSERLAQINSPCSTYLISFLTTCVPHKKLIQSAQYNLYRFAGYLKDLGPGTRNWGPRTGHHGAALSIAHNQPKKAKEIFVIFMTPKDTSIPRDNPPCTSSTRHHPCPLPSGSILRDEVAQEMREKKQVGRTRQENIFKDVSAIK